MSPPIDNIPVPLAATPVATGPSAPLQLCSVLCACDSVKPPRFAIPRALADRVNRFWNDGYSSLTELVVLADATGLLQSPEIDAFFERLLDPIVLDARPDLETEPLEEREAVYARLDRLASDGRLRRRYVAALRDLWAVVAPEWDGGGLERVLAAAEAWSTRLRAGADPLDLIPQDHIACRDEFRRLVGDAHRRGRLLLTPLANGYGHIVALPDLVSIAAPAALNDPVVARRAVATEVAERLRPLSDPTRLTILVQLAHGPMGVTELANALHIAQPTASVHLRQLRDAGLVAVERRGTRTIYSVQTGAVDDLLRHAASRLDSAIGRPVKDFVTSS